MNLEDAIMLPFKYLRKNEGSKSHSAPTSSSLVESSEITEATMSLCISVGNQG